MNARLFTVYSSLFLWMSSVSLESSPQETLIQERDRLAESAANLDPGDVAMWLERAENDDTAAQIVLGWAYRNGTGVEQNFTEALRWLARAAEQGHPIAQNAVGLLYRNGQGVERDADEALRWYRLAAERGYPSAYRNLGRAYFFGDGVPQDKGEAFAWHQKAADSGHPQAQFELAIDLFAGRDMPKDRDAAVDWFRKASDGGHAVATYNLGALYWDGMVPGAAGGVLSKHSATSMWETAAEQGYALGALNLAELYSKRGMAHAVRVPVNKVTACMWYEIAKALNARGKWDHLLGAEEEKRKLEIDKGRSKHRKKLDADELAECDARASVWLNPPDEPSLTDTSSVAPLETEDLKARYDTMSTLDLEGVERKANEGEAASQLLLGYACSEGRIVPRDVEESLRWYRLAADDGFAPAQLALGEMFYRGVHGPADYGEAMHWYRMAAEQGNPVAQNNVGSMHLEAHGVPKDVGEALRWFEKAAAGGNAGAMLTIGGLYERGEGLGESATTALKWYVAAAETGSADAQYALGSKYTTGDGAPRDHAQALFWFLEAAAQGHKDAQFNAGVHYEKGRGTTRDVDEAMRWLEQAAAQGDGAAMTNLGYLFRSGDGLPQDGNQAALWYLKAIEHHEMQQAPHNLAILYELAAGVPQDLVSAYMWRSLAHPDSRRDQKECVREVRKNMTKSQISDAERRAAAWPPPRVALCAASFASDDDVTGVLYELAPSCGGTRTLTKKAFSQLERDAQSGDAQAQCWLGNAYAHGLGTSKNFSKALAWHQKAAKQNHAPSQYALGNLFEYGRGVDKDPDTALKWYRLAADQGTTQAQAKLGLFYKEQWRDVEAVQLGSQAAEQGDPMAQVNLATHYADGRGVARDHVAAYSWFLVARAELCGPLYQSWKTQDPELSSFDQLVRFRDKTLESLSSQEAAEAEQRASELLDSLRTLPR